MMYKFTFYCVDNGGKRQSFIISAKDKASAIKKGFAKAKKNAKGDITNWDCRLQSMF